MMLFCFLFSKESIFEGRILFIIMVRCLIYMAYLGTLKTDNDIIGFNAPQIQYAISNFL